MCSQCCWATLLLRGCEWALEEHTNPSFPASRPSCSCVLQFWVSLRLRNPTVFLLLLSRRHGFEKQRMPAEQQNAAMRATLKRSLRSQRRLNKSADAAAIAAGFEPPSASSWTVRFRWSRVMIQAGKGSLALSDDGSVSNLII